MIFCLLLLCQIMRSFAKGETVDCGSLFLLSRILFSDKWRPFLLVSKHYFSPWFSCSCANVWQSKICINVSWFCTCSLYFSVTEYILLSAKREEYYCWKLLLLYFHATPQATPPSGRTCLRALPRRIYHAICVCWLTASLRIPRLKLHANSDGISEA